MYNITTSRGHTVGSAGPFLGGWQKSATGGGGGGTWKTTEFEGGHRVVGIASWRGMIRPGQVSHALLSTVDFLPTFASLAGVTLPSDRVYDGVDITDVLLHGKADGHTALYHPHGHGAMEEGVPAMRMGRWKAHFVTVNTQSCRGADGQPRTGTGRTITHGDILPSIFLAESECEPDNNHACLSADPPLIFDLSVDPGENSPVDPATVASEIEQLTQLCE